MAALPPALDKLATLLSRLPGVGKRTATRYAFHIVAESPDYADTLAETLASLRDHVHFCHECHALAEQEICRICADPMRDRTLICILEGIQDQLAIERTGTYRGLYHLLHGVLSPLKGIGPSQLRLANLYDRIELHQVTEVIVATSTDVEGEATAIYLGQKLGAIDGLRVSRIATGIPMGGELEYLDQNTLSRALEGRTHLAGRADG
ncbi:MAG: recombination protein RecR [Myxococcota bacterium]|jgi:recombination protein RecR